MINLLFTHKVKVKVNVKVTKRQNLAEKKKLILAHFKVFVYNLLNWCLQCSLISIWEYFV